MPFARQSVSALCQSMLAQSPRLSQSASQSVYTFRLSSGLFSSTWAAVAQLRPRDFLSQTLQQKVSVSTCQRLHIFANDRGLGIHTTSNHNLERHEYPVRLNFEQGEWGRLRRFETEHRMTDIVCMNGNPTIRQSWSFLVTSRADHGGND